MTQENKALQEDEKILDTSKENWTDELDSLLERDLKQQNYQKERNKNPDVKMNQKIYNQRKQRETRISRLYHSGNMTQAEAVSFLSDMKKDKRFVPDLSKWEGIQVSMDDIVSKG